MADEVRAIQFLLENDEAYGTFNLTAPHPVTNQEMAKELGDAMGRPSVIPVPAFAVKSAFGEMSDVVLKGQRVLPKLLEDMGFEFRYPSIEEAFEELVGDKTPSPEPAPA